MTTNFATIPRKDKVKWMKFINDFVKTKGWPPSVREIQKRFRVSSTSVVSYRLSRLEKDGYLHREHGITRGLRITEEGFNFLGER